MHGTPTIDAIIPVHDPGRPLARAVSSLLRSGVDPESDLRVTVICHNVAAGTIRALLPSDLGRHIRFLELDDGIPSPAGPFNLGIASADAEYVTIMGSDDQLEDDALRRWLAAARRMRATALIPPERHDSGARIRTPPVRPLRSGPLDPIRDRVAYRTAPLGLIRRDAFDELGLQFPTHLKNGSDQIVGLKLWFGGERIVYGRGLPAYVVGSDAGSRVTFTVRTAEEEFAAVSDLIRDPWFAERSLAERRAIVVKTVRVHVFSGALVRTRGERWTDDDREYLSALTARLGSAAPGFERALSIADRRLLDALAASSASGPELAALLRARSRFGHPLTVLTPNVRGLLQRDGPIRFMVASRLL